VKPPSVKVSIVRYNAWIVGWNGILAACSCKPESVSCDQHRKQLQQVCYVQAMPHNGCCMVPWCYACPRPCSHTVCVVCCNNFVSVLTWRRRSVQPVRSAAQACRWLAASSQPALSWARLDGQMGMARSAPTAGAT
jgi:hypothetical protein